MYCHAQKNVLIEWPMKHCNVLLENGSDDDILFVDKKLHHQITKGKHDVTIWHTSKSTFMTTEVTHMDIVFL